MSASRSDRLTARIAADRARSMRDLARDTTGLIRAAWHTRAARLELAADVLLGEPAELATPRAVAVVAPAPSRAA